jgi:phosphate transport system ATP-binding protein
MTAIDSQRPPVSFQAKLQARDLNVYYGAFHAVKNVSLTIPDRHVTALIGPSGCGKTTFLRALNRMHDLTPGARVQGRVLLDNSDIYDPHVDPVTIRHRIGMVFQRPNPFPQSIFDNVAYGPRLLAQPNASGVVDGSKR